MTETVCGEANWYAYGGNSLIMMVDPTGLEAVMLRYIIEKNGGSVTYDEDTGSTVINMPGYDPMTLSAINDGQVTVSVQGYESFTIDAASINGKLVVNSQFLMDNFALGEMQATHLTTDPFWSADDAAMAFGLKYNPISVKEGVEYGCNIYDYGDGTFSYGDVTKGGPNSVNISVANPNFTLVGIAYTHGTYIYDSSGNPTSGSLGYDYFSEIIRKVDPRTGISTFEGDGYTTWKTGVPCYVFTPEGNF